MAKGRRTGRAGGASGARGNAVASSPELWRYSSASGMKRKIPLEQLLRWRHQKAASEAPPAPGAAELIERARPWWEKQPEKFQLLVERLNKIRIAPGCHQLESDLGRHWHSVPALVIHGKEISESSVRVLFFRLRDAKLRLQFRLESPVPLEESSFEATFISEAGARALFATTAPVSAKLEFTIDTELPTEIEGIGNN